VKDFASKHLATGRLDIPACCGCLDEQRSRDSTRLAQDLPFVACAGGPRRYLLPAEERHPIERIIRRRMLDAHLIEVDPQLFGQEKRRAGIDRLPHLSIRHDEAHEAVANLVREQLLPTKGYAAPKAVLAQRRR
jgi:hypothetical protein